MDDLLLLAIIGFVFGMIGVAAGIAAIIYATGYFEYMGGKKRNTSAVKKSILKEKLLGLNSPKLPFTIKPGKETDLEVEWKIVDSKWYSLFAKEKLSKTYRAWILIDDDLKSVRYCEELGSVEWYAGAGGDLVPKISYQKSFLRGRILFKKTWEVRYAFKENLEPGKIFEYFFDVDLIKGPIASTVEKNGWEFVPVVRKEHATHEKP